MGAGKGGLYKVFEDSSGGSGDICTPLPVQKAHKEDDEVSSTRRGGEVHSGRLCGDQSQQAH